MYAGRLLVLGLIGASVVRSGPMHTGKTADRVHTAAPRVVVGDRPPLPTAQRATVRPVHTPAPWLLRNLTRVVRGEAPPLPLARATRFGEWHTGAQPIVAALIPHPRVVRGDPPPLPTRVRQVVIPPPEILTFQQDALAPRVVRGDSPPTPEGRSTRTAGQFHTGAAPSPDINHEILEPRIVHADAPPAPTGRVARAGRPATVVTFNQPVSQPAIVRGETPPTPTGQALRTGQFHTGATPPVTVALVPTTRVVRTPTPTPGPRVVRTGEFHTGAEPAPLATEGGFLGRAFMN